MAARSLMSSRPTQRLFGTPGDFIDRHQGAALTIAFLLIVLGSAL
jgi:hypothetical protein